MKLSYLMVLGVAVIGMMFSDLRAYAQQARGEANVHRLLGSSQAQQLWTADDVKTACEGRWRGQARPIQTCITRNQRKIGRPQTLGELQELQAQRSGAPAAKKTKKSATKEEESEEETESDTKLKSKPKP